MTTYQIWQSRELRDGTSRSRLFTTPHKLEAILWVKRLNKLSKKFNLEFDAVYFTIGVDE